MRFNGPLLSSIHPRSITWMNCTGSPALKTVAPVGRVRRSTSGCSWISSRGVSGAEADKAITGVGCSIPFHPVEAISNGGDVDGSRLTSSCDPAPADALQHRCSAEPEAWGNGGSSGDRPSDLQSRHAPPTGADGTTPSHLPAGCSTDNCDSRSWRPNKSSGNALKLVTVCETDHGQGQISGFPSGS